jgi:hypothetical protein
MWRLPAREGQNICVGNLLTLCVCIVQGTFYGQQSGQNDAGACSYGKNNANSLSYEWSTGVDTFIALNQAQFNSSGTTSLVDARVEFKCYFDSLPTWREDGS